MEGVRSPVTPPRGKPHAVVFHDDCLRKLRTLPANTFTLLYTNPPFGITQAEWDKPLPWGQLWPEIWRVLKPNGAVVLHCSMTAQRIRVVIELLLEFLDPVLGFFLELLRLCRRR